MRKIILPLLIAVFVFILILPANAPIAADADSVGESVSLPVIMYHNILENKKSEYVISAKQFESDLIAFKKAGYTTVFPSEVIAYAEGRGTLPKKPILITFDDGRYNNLYYALPLLKKYNGKAAINIIGAFSEYSTVSGDDSNPYYSHLTWAQIKKLADSGHFEIGNHTYNMHRFKPRYGVSKESGETEAEYIKSLQDDISRLQNKIKKECGVTPEVFAYPFGKFNPTVKKVLLDNGFNMLLTCTEGNNIITQGNTECLRYIKRYNRNSKYSSEKLLEIIADKKASA